MALVEASAKRSLNARRVKSSALPEYTRTDGVAINEGTRIAQSDAGSGRSIVAADSSAV
ncbi:MAG: hypothetical protein JO002_01775 [Burkholderiaceae bacterium]|nr:hypothetical protein [Burkholderiaceae bacterium]